VKEEVRRIIKMVEEGKLSAEDAAELIEAFSGGPSQEASSAEEEPVSQAEAEATKDQPKEKEGKDFFKAFTETIEKISKDASDSVNWKEIADQARSSASKGFEALKDVGEKISKGKFEFNLFHAHETRKVELPLSLSSGKTLRIENPCGDVRIVGGFDEGHVIAQAKVNGSSIEDAREKANGYTLVIEESDELVLIKQPDMSGLSVDLNIQIPEKRFVEIKAESGDISVLDTKSGVRVTNRSGNIHLRQLNGPIEVTAYSGDIKIEDAKTPSLTIESKSGDISLTRIEGNINSRTASGDVKVTSSSGKTISIEAVSGDVQLDLDTPVTGSLNVRTVSGDSLVSIVDGSDGRVSLSTLRGDVQCTVKLEDEAKSDQRITGRLGEGKGTLDISAVTGNVTLEMHNSVA
jgi:DUF4097 and DUF4098 domain-containing protein YvlB